MGLGVVVGEVLWGMVESVWVVSAMRKSRSRVGLFARW